MTWTRQVTAGKATAKAMLIVLGELADEDDQVRRTQHYLSTFLECSERATRNALEYLEEHGFIGREKRKGGVFSKSDVITLNIGTFTSTKNVDMGEDDLEIPNRHETPEGLFDASHPAREAGTIRHETPHAIRHETPHIKINNLNLTTKKDTGADAPAGPATTPPASFEKETGPHGYPMTTQGIIAEWVDNCRFKPAGRVLGQMSKEVKNQFEAGYPYEAIREGLQEVHVKDLHPSTLASTTHSAAQRLTTSAPAVQTYSAAPQLATGTQRAMQALAAGQQLQAAHDQQNQQNGITSGFESDRAALGPGSADRQSESGPGTDSGMVGNPQPFVFR